MGNLSFILPEKLNKSWDQELLLSYFAGGPDYMPFYGTTSIHENLLSLKKDEPDSCFLNVPWKVGNQGVFISPTSTLPSRSNPYSLVTELARGKVNQLRNFTADWEFGGLKISQEIKDKLSKATLEFGKSFSTEESSQKEQLLQNSIESSYQGSETLIREYMRQIFNFRHQDNQPIETGLSAKVSKPFSTAISQRIEKSFTNMHLDINWKKVEASQGVFSWDETDKTLECCLATGMEVVGGPIIHMTKETIPEWLIQTEGTASQYATTMARFLDTTIRRYQGKIHRWIICSGLNVASMPVFGDETYFKITTKLAEIAKQIDSSLEIIIGITHPWGEYIASKRRDFSPLGFMDNLCRAGLNLAAIDLEIVMGSSSNSSFCRDMLETSRLLDIYSSLGMPITVSLGYPSISAPEDVSDSTFGNWKGPKSLETQADWAESFTSLLLSKRYIQAVQWVRLSDDMESPFPNCGLFDANWEAKPALACMEKIRKMHLR